MAKAFNIEVKGVPEVKAYIGGKSKKATTLMSLGLAQAAIYVQGEVKISISGRGKEPTSVDTGRFLNSVGIKKKGKSNAIVFSDLSYAKYLEYGTSKITARKHFRNTAARSRGKIKDILNREIKKV